MDTISDSHFMILLRAAPSILKEAPPSWFQTRLPLIEHQLQHFKTSLLHEIIFRQDLTTLNRWLVALFSKSRIIPAERIHERVDYIVEGLRWGIATVVHFMSYVQMARGTVGTYPLFPVFVRHALFNAIMSLVSRRFGLLGSLIVRLMSFAFVNLQTVSTMESYKREMEIFMMKVDRLITTVTNDEVATQLEQFLSSCISSINTIAQDPSVPDHNKRAAHELMTYFESLLKKLKKT